MFYERLKAACKNADTTVTATLKAIGIGTANGTYWKKGSIPSSDIIVKLSEFLNVSTDYLLLGTKSSDKVSKEQQTILSIFESLSSIDKARVIERAETLAELAAERVAEQEQISQAKYNHSNNAKKQKSVDTYEIRYYDYAASAGTGLFLDEAIAESLTVRSTPEAQQADYAIPVSGDSMEDEYHDGDIVLVKSCPCVCRGEVGIFLLNGNVYIKEYGGKLLISYNPNYDPIDLSRQDSVVCLGKVLGIAEVIS